LNGALEHAGDARTLLERLTKADAEDPLVHREWCESLLLQGELLASLGRANEAQDAWQHALDVIRPFANDSRDSTLLSPLAVSLIRLGRADEAQPIVDQLRSAGLFDRRCHTQRSRGSVQELKPDVRVLTCVASCSHLRHYPRIGEPRCGFFL